MTETVEAPPRGTRFAAAAALLAASVLLSRLLGLVRDRVLAHQIGAGAETDAYGAAFLLPDILNYFLAGGALSIAFIPLYTRARTRDGAPAAGILFGKVLGTMTALSIAATLLLAWQAEALVGLAFPRFSPEIQALTVRLTRIVLPAQIFFVAGGILRAVLMAEGRFASQALAPVVYNLGIIAGGIGLGGPLGAEGFAWGALAGAALGPFAIPMLEILRRADLPLRPRFALFDADLRRYLVLAAPLMLGVTLVTVDEWYDKFFGGLAGVGALASLGYARRLMQVPVAMVGQAIATAAMPTLARLWSEGRREELDALLLGALRTGLGLAVLGTAGFLAFAEPIVGVVIETGRFTGEDTVRVGVLLTIFSLAVPAWITQQIAVRAFYARGQMWLPMLLGSGVALLALPLYAVLGRGYGAPGLAAAGVLGMSANALLTLTVARARHGGPELGGLFTTGLRAACIAAPAAAAGVLMARTVEGALADLLVGGGLFGGLALAGVLLFGDAPLRDGLGRVLRRLRPRREA